jgi:hypothetical protein
MPKFLGYLEAVAMGWHLTLQNTDACRILDYKLRNTAKELKWWSQKFVESIRLQQAVAREVIFKLEQAQDQRQLLEEEITLWKELKWKTLGLDSLSQTIARQRSESSSSNKGMRTPGSFICKHVITAAKTRSTCLTIKA